MSFAPVGWIDALCFLMALTMPQMMLFAVLSFPSNYSHHHLSTPFAPASSPLSPLYFCLLLFAHSSTPVVVTPGDDKGSSLRTVEDLVLGGNLCHLISFALVRRLSTLFDLGLWFFIVPSFSRGFKSSQNATVTDLILLLL